MTAVAVAIAVNDRRIAAMVEPRTHLGDFLREHCRLTGTHLGCEHGVCGSCTVLIDGATARSCIAFAAACDGRAVRTIEGFDDDALMQELREAFSREHALQCGFCTPGMLIAARDLVLRRPNADERLVRLEMSGNLCRCTGYAGIVNAILSIIAARRADGGAPAAPPAAAAFTPFIADTGPAERVPAAAVVAAEAGEARTGWTRFEESFVIGLAPDAAWRALADLSLVAACLPGAELIDSDERSARGRMTVKLGPIVAGFTGTAAIERDVAMLTTVLRGAGADRGTGSRTRGEVTYRLSAADGGSRTRVALVVDYHLQGALAQFSRAGIAQALGRRLVAEFAANLDARLAAPMAVLPSARPAPLHAGGMLRRWLLERLRRLLGH